MSVNDSKRFAIKVFLFPKQAMNCLLLREDMSLNLSAVENWCGFWASAFKQYISVLFNVNVALQSNLFQLLWRNEHEV